jgi:hypothetical protein
VIVVDPSMEHRDVNFRSRKWVRNMISRSSILSIEQIVFVSLGPDGRPMAHGYSEATYARDRIPDPGTLG